MRPTETEEFPAPVSGWWTSGNLATAPKGAAEVLDNWFPTAETVRVRRGSASYADLGAAVVQLMPYSGGGTEDLLGATASSVFDCERIAVGGLNTFAEYEGQTSGDWASSAMSTSGGDFMIAVNGTDLGWYWDGSEVNPINAASINDLAFDAQTAAFAIGETVTGGTSAATATIHGITRTSATEGILKVGAITGTFQDNETITDGATGSATSNIPSGTSVGSTIAITNVATTALSHVWAFGERLFFIEGNTLSAWYLPTQQLGGAAVELPLYGVFKKGGSLLFGATWTVDGGFGADDLCVFATTEGEVAVFSGTDPASVSTWQRVGTYHIGQPVNKHAAFRSGADLLIMTQDGVVSMRSAMVSDRAGIQPKAITFPIETAWLDAFRRNNNYAYSATVLEAEGMLLMGVPPTQAGEKIAFVQNIQTGAWCRYTGWDVECSATSADKIYFAGADGIVYQGETGGDDNGASYTAICVPKFSTYGPQRKFLTRAHYIMRAPAEPVVKMKGLGDYEIPSVAGPSATPASADAVWGTGVWGTFEWNATSSLNTYNRWMKVTGKGFSVSVAVLVTSLDEVHCDVELVAMRLRYERGSIL